MILTDSIYYGKNSDHSIYKKSKEEKLFLKNIGKPFDKKLSYKSILEKFSKEKMGQSTVFYKNWKLGEFYEINGEYELAAHFFVEAFDQGRYFAGKYMEPFLFEAINFSSLGNENKATIRRMVEFAGMLFPNGPNS